MKHLLPLILLLTSCTSTQENPSVVEESSEIVSEYADTLENSVIDARSVVESMNKQTEKINEQIDK